MQFRSTYFGSSYNRFFMAWSVIAIGLTAAFVQYSAHARTTTVYDPEPLDAIVHPPAEITQNPPMDTRENWMKSVCMDMTAGGCEYFRAHRAAAIWDEQLGNIGSLAGYISKTTLVDENHEVWTARTSIFTRDPNAKHSTEENFEVHVFVKRGADLEPADQMC